MDTEGNSALPAVIEVVLPVPAHSRLPEVLSYSHFEPLAVGTLVRVPLGARELLGLVWRSAWAGSTNDTQAAVQLRPIASVIAIGPLSPSWCQLISFAAQYYQRHMGELALAALPPKLRELDEGQLMRLLVKRSKAGQGFQSPASPKMGDARLALSPEQAKALAELTQLGEPQAQSDKAKPVLLFGATGSGKTEVYLRRVEAVLAAAPDTQALVLVPEINLTPQLEARFLARIEAQCGAGSVVLMHSGMTPAQRLASWLAAHEGSARLVLGTRLAVLASIPQLALVIVDEEHDPSYKSQDGARYSARDLAVYRAGVQGAQVILGSATPSLETWHNASSQPPRYQRIDMPARISSAAMPSVRIVDLRLTNQEKKVNSTVHSGIAPELREAIEQRMDRGEQSLLFLNRRGYAPVLHCNTCDWKSDCPNCSAHMVFHKTERRLRCHHCAWTLPVPKQCPACGNIDIGTQGRGTEQLEEAILAALPARARVLRIDADSAKGKGRLEAQLASMHAGEVDVLVGTQMVTKGHDFRRITLVAAMNPDSALFAADFRAPERLFALLMQAAGRAGRDAAVSAKAQMWLQTHHPSHPLYQALIRHDYPAFAKAQLAERQLVAMPPFSYQALLRCEAKTQAAAQAFLDLAAAQVQTDPVFESWRDPQSASFVTLYPAVPMPMQRVAGIERAQMLIESSSRSALQKMLTMWQPYVRDLTVAGIYRWALDVDPLTI